MISSLWRPAWEGEESPRALIAARVLIATQSLWVLASRPDLPALFSWPEPFWIPVGISLRWRFLVLGLSEAAEWTLYALLGASLLAAALGVAPRAACLLSAVLAYHFAPLEDIFAAAGSGSTYFRGLTTNILSLIVLAVAEKPRWNAAPSVEFRWPLTLVRLLFATNYFMAGFAKLRSVGIGWASAANFEGLILGVMLPEIAPPWAHLFVDRPLLCAFGGIAGLAMDFSVPLAAFSYRAARIVVPAIAVVHVLIWGVFGVTFLAAPLLLLFANWGRLLASPSARLGPEVLPRASEPIRSSPR